MKHGRRREEGSWRLVSWLLRDGKLWRTEGWVEEGSRGFNGAGVLALSSAKASQKALWVMKLSFLQKGNTTMIKFNVKREKEREGLNISMQNTRQ